LINHYQPTLCKHRIEI